MRLDPRHRQELIAIVSLLVGVFIGLTLLPWDVTGPAGRFGGRLLWTYLGLGAPLIPVAGVGLALAGFGRLGGLDLRRAGVFAGAMLVLAPFAVALVTGARSVADFPPDYDAWSLAQRLAGLGPAAIAVGTTAVVGTAGAVILGVLALSALTIYTFGWHPFRRLAAGAGGRRDTAGDAWAVPAAGADEDDLDVLGEADRADGPAGGTRRGRSTRPSDRPTAGGGVEDEGFHELPPLDLLSAPPPESLNGGDEEIERLGRVLIDTLGTFRVEGRIVGRTIGPVVTQYEVAPAPGVKVGRIASLADDLALAMRAPSIRIVAPIPGKAAVGVEVPNPQPRIVTLRELLGSPEWDRSRAILPLALGRNLEGRPIVADLAKMPHLLIAGATGSGKSVCINGIITSLVYRYTPRELRMLLIDPKMVELSTYDALPHLRHPVVTNNRQAAQALRWTILEMERRYALFHANGARNIGDFNRRVLDGRGLVEVVSSELGAGLDAGRSGSERLATPPEIGRATAAPAHRSPRTRPYDDGPLPFIVIVVDELADLMMTVQAEVEKPLAILAQKARATGIHLLLATQRPSVNVITGLIKANFPSRIAFRVASKVDSRTILDQNGAETLLGNGDMLFLPPGRSEPIRIQGAFIGTEETEGVTAWYGARIAAREAELARRGLVGARRTEDDILAIVEALEAEEHKAGGAGPAPGERDALFRDAAETCISNQLGSTSLLQRKLRIGYGRAARIIDQLHDAGILGPPDGSKPREVLIGIGQLDEYCDG